MTRPTLLLGTVLLAVTFALAHAGTIRERRQAIPREFQNVNIENYLKNPRAVQFQLKCVIDEGPCDRIGKYLKVTIPELLTNQCRNCSPDQRRQAGRLVAYIQQNYKKEWAAAVKKFQGGAISESEIHKFEQDYGVKIDGVSTETPSGDGVPVSNAPVTLDEISSIVKDFKANAPKLEFTKPLPGTPEHAAAAKAAAAKAAAAPAAPAPAPAAVAAPAAAPAAA